MTDSYSYEAIAKMIDHSLLNPSLTSGELEEGIALAIRYDVASVCILPYYLARCAELLNGTAVRASPPSASLMAGTPQASTGRSPPGSQRWRGGIRCGDQHQQGPQQRLAVRAG